MKNKWYYSILGSLFLVAFLFLGYLVRFQPDWLTGIDQSITTLIRTPYPHANTFFIFVTKLANPLTISLITLSLCCLLYKQHYFTELGWLLINTAVIAGLLNPLLKLLFMRQRPTLTHLVSEHSYSFPSGHSAGSMLLYGTLIFLCPQFIKNSHWCLFFQLLLGCGILFIGISRIYVGVHFPSDVLGGFCLGLAWLLLTYPIYLKKQQVGRFSDKSS